jgi:hypothetical protein
MGRGSAVTVGAREAATWPHNVPNRVLFREVNEQLRSREPATPSAGSQMTIVCECERRDCFRHLRIPVERYDAIRDFAAQFVVSVGHAVDAEEVIIEVESEFLVVQQTGAVAQTAIRFDPRARRPRSPAAADEAPAQ